MYLGLVSLSPFHLKEAQEKVSLGRVLFLGLERIMDSCQISCQVTDVHTSYKSERVV